MLRGIISLDANVPRAQACVNREAQLLAAELTPRGVLVNSVTPGWCRTDMGGWIALRSAAKGARSVVMTATAEDGMTGRFYKDGVEVSVV